MRMKIKMKNKSHRFEAQFMKKLSNTEAELKKSVAYKKKRIIACASLNTFPAYNFIIKNITRSFTIFLHILKRM